MEIYSSELKLNDHLSLFFDSLRPGDLVLLSAELGLGKTSFVKSFLDYKGALKSVEFSSPSYNLIQNYKLKDLSIYHIDLYRLDNEDQIESTGLWESLEDDKSICFIEWPEKIKLADLPQRPTYFVEIIDESLKNPKAEEKQRLYRIKKLSETEVPNLSKAPSSEDPQPAS